MATVRVGDRDLTISEFSGYKFLEATDRLAHLLEVVPDLDGDMAKFGREWRESNPPRVLDRATAELEFGEAAKISDEAWAATGGHVTLTPRVDGMQLFLRVFPRLQRHARGDIEELLALIVTANSELEEADTLGADIYEPDQCVGRNRRFLLHKGSPSELAKVALAAMEALGDELKEGDLMGAVGKLRDRWTDLTAGTPDDKPQEEEPPPNRAARRRAPAARRSPTTSSGSTPAAASAAPTSSTGSPTAT